MKRKGRVTLQDIANAVGKSRMTVSLALRDHPKISVKTRDLIKQTAEKLGYQSDPGITKLMNHLRMNKVATVEYTLAYLNHHPNKGIRGILKDVDLFYYEAEKQARRLGYKIEEYWTQDPKTSPKRLSQILHARGIQGVIVGPTSLDAQVLQLDWNLFSSIALGYSLLKPDLHRILSNRYENTLLALEMLRKNGYKRIGCAIWRDLDNLIHNSYTSAISTYNLDRPVEDKACLFRPSRWSKKAFLHWLEKTKPDVIYASPDDASWLGEKHPEKPTIVSWLQEEGIRIPQDVAFAMELDHDWPIDFTGTRSNLAQLGKIAVNFLNDQIMRAEKGVPGLPITITVKGKWHPGCTAPAKD